MSNPIFPVVCTKNQYTKIATNISTISVFRQKTDTHYLYTYRQTGDTAPTLRSEAVRLFIKNQDYEEISKQIYVDIYVWCDDADGVLLIGEGKSQPIPSIIQGSNVIEQESTELVKKGHMFTVQKVFTGISVNTTIDFLVDLSLVTVSILRLYEISFSVTQGKQLLTFLGQGDYSGGTAVPIFNRNENSSQTPQVVITKDPVGTTPGAEWQSFIAGGEVQGNNLAGGNVGDEAFPNEIDKSVSRLMRFVQSGGTGTFDFTLRFIYAEIP